MEIKDKVYGEEKIKEQVLIDLINSKIIQRLKSISQMGLPQEYYHKNVFSRYEHSVGVLILIRKLNGNLKEQIAGLLHDVSHTAFSHVIDWVLGDPTKEDYQDNIHLSVVENSEIPEILKKHGFDYNEISKIENFSLLEKEMPALCADRIDYSLRELKEENFELVKKIVFDLSNQKGQIVFKNKEIAEIFARGYSKLQKEHWGGDEARARYFILAEALKEAIERKIILISDLRNTDDYVMRLLNKSGNKKILEKLNLLTNGFEMRETKEGVILKKKFRYIDPEVLVGERIVSLTKISFDYASFLKEEKQCSKNHLRVLILKK